MRPRFPWLSVFASLLVLLSAACAGADGAAGSDPTSTADDDVATRDAQPGTDMSSPGAQQLDFVLPALGGGEVRGQALVGKPVALWFWTPW